MCGIAGIFEYSSGKGVTTDRIVAMTNPIAHRGPDDSGSFVENQVGLGMRRLSIIDVAGGHQPLSNEDDTVYIVFNGEIYNFAELRRDLESRGHTFKTRTDTEAIVHLYEEYGDECVRRLDGMFAFALYDKRAAQPRLLMARDRFGKKPLYYCDIQGALLFGSELKCLLTDSRVSREVDPEALHHYLSLLMVPTPFSIFRSVKKLPPAHYAVCDRQGLKISPYWNYVDCLGEREISEREAAAEIRRLLLEAVEKRLVADVPLGAFLSGGLDSSTVVAMMSRAVSVPVRTFSIGFAGSKAHDETPYARLVARHCKTDHQEFQVQPDILELLPQVLEFADEPFAISSAIPTYLLARETRKFVKVVLTGDGGDEIFGGYHQYLYERWAKLYRKLPSGTDELLRSTTNLLGRNVKSVGGRVRRRVHRFTNAARLEVAQRRLGWSSSFSESEKIAMVVPHTYPVTETADFLGSRIAGASVSSPEAEQNLMDILVLLPDEMLTKVDRMTMGASLEARSPLLDYRLAQFLAALPFRMKFPGIGRQSGLKVLLKNIAREFLPSEIIDRPKHGFNLPMDAWIRGGARKYVESVLSPERIRKRGIFRPEQVSGLLAEHLNGNTNANNRIYALLVFELWAERYL